LVKVQVELEPLEHLFVFNPIVWNTHRSSGTLNVLNLNRWNTWCSIIKLYICISSWTTIV